MKRTMDDFARWRLQKENTIKPFPYIFPDMPPRFRRSYVFMKTVFLLELIFFWIAALGSCVFCIPLIVFGMDAVLANPLLAFCMITAMTALGLCFVMMLVGMTPGFFWHCPCCGQPFPYYAPNRIRADMLKRKECLLEMENLRIKYVHNKYCPLILPSVCPECRAKFFDVP